MKSTKLPLTLPEYERVYQVIHSVLSQVGEPQNACIFFAVVGALILDLKHGIKCHPVAGAAAYFVDGETETVCTFGRIEEGALISDSEAFHCWVETDEWAVDFIAPLFRESLAQRGSRLPVDRRSFQKKLTALAQTLNDLRSEGDFALLPNPGLSRQLFSVFDTKLSYSDLAKVCLACYEPYPKKLRVTKMNDNAGYSYALRFSAPAIQGAW